MNRFFQHGIFIVFGLFLLLQTLMIRFGESNVNLAAFALKLFLPANLPLLLAKLSFLFPQFFLSLLILLCGFIVRLSEGVDDVQQRTSGKQQQNQQSHQHQKDGGADLSKCSEQRPAQQHRKHSSAGKLHAVLPQPAEHITQVSHSEPPYKDHLNRTGKEDQY